MAVFHTAFDLSLFGYLPPGTTLQGGWWWLARIVAGSFLLLSGISLALAHAGGVRWDRALRRLAILALAAAAISVATWAFMPQSYVYFGILHCIAAASLVGLILLPLPVAAQLALAAGILLLDRWGGAAAFDPRLLAWTGLAAAPPPAVDFVPLVPWLAPFLAGLATGKAIQATGLATRLAAPAPAPLLRWLGWPGRHSLALYLVHQPILVGAIWLYAQLAPPTP